MKPTFFSSFLVLDQTSGDFSMARHSFQPRTSIFPRSVLYFPTLRALLREISPFISLRTPLCAQREYFSDSGFPFSPIFLTFIFPTTVFPPHNHPTLFAPSPISFSFLPTFPPPSPINTRTRTSSRITCARVHPHTPTRQEVFVYCLHLFTQPSQSAVQQRVRGEEKREKAFTKCTTASQSKH